MYSEYSNQELLNMIREIMKEITGRHQPNRLVTREQALFLIVGLSPEEITEEQEQAASEAIDAIRAEQKEQIKEEARKKEERQQRERKAQRKQIANWTKKREIAKQVKAILGEDWSLNVWNGSDKRVYLNGTSYRNACYYVTGNKWNPPGHLEIERLKLDPADKEILQEICRQAAEQWRETKFDIDVAAAWSPPRPIGVGKYDIEVEPA